MSSLPAPVSRSLKLKKAKVTSHKKKLGMSGQPSMGIIKVNHTQGTRVTALEMTYLDENFISSLTNGEEVDIEITIRRKKKS